LQIDNNSLYLANNTAPNPICPPCSSSTAGALILNVRHEICQFFNNPEHFNAADLNVLVNERSTALTNKDAQINVPAQSFFFFLYRSDSDSID